MIRQTQVAVWFLLTSLLFSICFGYAPPLSSIQISMRGKQKEQIIKSKGENINKRGSQVDQDARPQVDGFSPLRLYDLQWRDRDGGDGLALMRRVPSLSSPHPHSPTIPVRRGKDGIKWNVGNISTTSNATNPTAATTTTTTTTPTTTTTTTTTTATSMIYSFVPSFYDPPSPFSLVPSSSCSSPACKWLASWQFIAVVCMTLAWLVALMTLYCLTRTTRGKLLLEVCSSLCTQDKKDKDEVQTRGIGYFDGSPGLRRFVLIEDEKEEEDEADNSDTLFTSGFWEVRSKEDKEAERGGEREERISRKWTPPMRGTYILQEASKRDVLEVGTYRLQEKEEEEVDGKRKRKGKMEKDKEEEMEYILEGATYILQSEKVGGGGVREIGGEESGRVGGTGGERGGYGHIGGIEGLYGIVGREVLQGGGGGRYGRVGGLGIYGIMGNGVVGGMGGGRYRRVGGIEGLYEILQDKLTGGEGDRRGEGGGDDGVLLSVRELVRAVGGREREEKVREESKSGGGGTGAESEEWREIGGDTGGELEKGRGGGRSERGGEKRGKVGGGGTSGAKRDKREKGVDEREKERVGRRDVHISDTWGGRRGGEGVNATLGGVGEGNWRGRTPVPKRAASFPMDHFLSSHLMPRKLSLIVEEETH